MAGGDGSLAAVAAVAIERDMPFVCVPFGTRNHFARDLGLDRDDPLGALAAFDGRRAADRRRPRRRAALPQQRLARPLRAARAPARAPPAAARRARTRCVRSRSHCRTAAAGLFTIDGDAVRGRVVLVANNHYSLELLSLGERERIDDGLLHLYVPHGLAADRLGRAHARPRSRSARRCPGSGPRSTASRWSSTRRFGSRSSRGRYACSCLARQSDRIGT